ncbi:Pantothenate transporter liz1 [Paramyrothecium foliicola]|nr:Pantothenate transporter liz1 [Paramyrothecium foliicola]
MPSSAVRYKAAPGILEDESTVNELSGKKQGSIPLAGDDLAGPLRKLTVLLPCVASTLLALLLLAGMLQNWTLNDRTRNWITQHRAVTSTIVSVLAAVLATIQIATCRTLVNFYARSRLVSRPLSLDRISLYSSLTTSQLAWSLPLPHMLVIGIVTLGCLVPNALWTGAFTPVDIVLTSSESIVTPRYSEATQAQWNQPWYDTRTVTNIHGKFTYGPTRSRFGSFSNDGSTASSIKQGVPVFVTKADNSNYTYYGRSYGVGAAVGIFDNEFKSSQTILSYTFSEDGYRSLWSCFYNRTTNSVFRKVPIIEGNPKMFIAQAASPLTGEMDGGYNVSELNGNGGIVSAKPFYDTENWTRNYSAPIAQLVIMSIGEEYAGLDKMQCAASIIPTRFDIHVDAVDRKITVVPNGSIKNTTNIDPTGFVASAAIDTFAAMSRTSTTSYTSLNGDILMSNVYNVGQARKNGGDLRDTEDLIPDDYTQGVSSALQALADQRLFSFSGAQLFITQDSARTPVVAQSRAMRIGQEGFIFAVVALCMLLNLAVGLEMARTRFWQGMPTLDIANVEDMAVAASRGGTGLMKAVANTEAMNYEGNVKYSKVKVENISIMAEAIRFKAKVANFIWGESTKEERQLIRKLDRAAFANAYVAGLQEALNLTGSNYNVLLSMASAGMLVGQIPNSLVIHKIRPSIWLPSMVLVWAGLTMASAACRTYAQLCVVRFFMGLAEASTYAGCIYVMGSWYKPNEIAKRTAMFTVAGQAGSMFAGIMMAAIHRTMNGRGGLEGWQWVFLIDGIITCPVAFFGYFYFPDLPENTRARYLNEEERKLALGRLPPKREDGHNIAPWSLTKRVLGQPTIYICCGFSLFSAALQAYSVQGLMLLYLKSRRKIDGWTQTQINTMPLGIQAVGIVTEFLAASAIDQFDQRMSTGFALLAIQTVSSIVLLIPNMSVNGNLAALYLAATAYGINPLLYGWPNIMAARDGDDAARSVILAAMVASGMLLYTFWGIVLYPADHAPYWRNGYIAMICIIVFLGCWLFLLRWLDGFTARKQAAERDTTIAVEEKIQENADES